MKKTILLIAALVLGATSVNAQKFISLGQQPQNIQKAVVTNPRTNEANLRSQAKQDSKATKDAEMLVDFSDTTAYTLGVLSNHTAGTAQGMFLRIDTSAGSGTLLTNNYANWVGVWYTATWAGNHSFSYIANILGGTIGNGFALVSPLEVYEAAGENLTNNKVYNTYIKCNNPIVTTGWNCVKISFKQITMRFNSDRYYIDYSTDPNFATYDSIELNIKGLEVAANDYAKINRSVTLPVSETVNKTLYIRLRYYCPAVNTTQPSGYFWLVDEIQAENGDAYAITTKKTYHAGSAYHVIPQGLTLDSIYSYADIENIGGNDFTDIALNESHYSVSSDGSTYTFLNQFIGDADTISTAMYNDTTTDDNNVVTSIDRRRDHVIKAQGKLSTANVGSFCAITTLNYTDENHAAVAKATGDTISYSVVAVPENGTSVRWARDYDAIFKGYVWEGGFTGDFFTDRCPGVYTAGYTVCNQFIVPKTLTGDWWIKGVEIVPGPDSCEVGAKVKGLLTYLDPTATQWTNVIKDVVDENDEAIGSNTYTVSNENELNNGALSDQLTATRQYNSIWLPFTKSVKLDTLTYYACYKLMSNGTKFAVGMDNNAYNFKNANLYNSYVYSTNDGGSTYPWGYWFGSSYSDYQAPMIRLKLSNNSSSIADVASNNFELSAYPNPAKESFAINYTLNNSGNVVITVTDIMGREVVRMNQGMQTANSSHNVVVNTENLQNGTYFYTVNVNGAKQTNKLIVNK